MATGRVKHLVQLHVVRLHGELLFHIERALLVSGDVVADQLAVGSVEQEHIVGDEEIDDRVLWTEVDLVLFEDRLDAVRK